MKPTDHYLVKFKVEFQTKRRYFKNFNETAVNVHILPNLNKITRKNIWKMKQLI